MFFQRISLFSLVWHGIRAMFEILAFFEFFLSGWFLCFCRCLLCLFLGSVLTFGNFCCVFWVVGIQRHLGLGYGVIWVLDFGIIWARRTFSVLSFFWVASGFRRVFSVPSCHLKSLTPSLFILLVKIIRLGSFNFNYLSKGKNCGVILMGVIPHLKMSRLCLNGKSWMLGL